MEMRPETNDTWRAFEQDALPYRINLIHLNPDGLQAGVWKLGLGTFRGRYNIGFFLWEQPELPGCMDAGTAADG